jgi:hypothetical protein
MSLKELIKRIPLVGPAAQYIYRTVRGGTPAPFSTSEKYWEDRYRSGGNSGAGSYNRLAQFKADFLNQFVADHKIESVIEFGSGDGAQLRLAAYPRYIGVDVSETVLAQTRTDFAANPAFSFLHVGDVGPETRAELSLSLDVIYHLVEDEIFETYMASLFAAAQRYVIVYASNVDGGRPGPHVRHRKFTDWVETNRGDFALVEHVENKYPYSDADRDNTSFADFFVFRKTSPAA